MTNITQIMMSLIKNAIGSVSEIPPFELSEDSIKALYKLSKSHDLTHLLVHPIEQNKLIEDATLFAPFQKEMYMAVYRYNRIKYEFDCLCDVLEEAKIPFIPLKGVILRSYYPQPWMRTSCDIDVFVDKENLTRAIDCLKGKLGYTEKGHGPHDVSLYSKNGTHIELHYELIEDERVNGVSRLLSHVWDYSHPVDGYSYRYEMEDEMFYFYHIAHMAKHFEIGGCGVRPFLDIWVLNHRMDYDAEKRDSLLKDGDLIVFANAAKQLSEVWFGESEHTEVTLQMEEYLIDAGIYGNSTNSVAVRYTKKGGKFKYLLSRIWIPYDKLKYVYPSLENRRFLTLFYQIRRWFRIFSKKEREKLSNEMRIMSNQSNDTATQTANLFKKLGINI